MLTWEAPIVTKCCLHFKYPSSSGIWENPSWISPCIWGPINLQLMAIVGSVAATPRSLLPVLGAILHLCVLCGTRHLQRPGPPQWSAWEVSHPQRWRTAGSTETSGWDKLWDAADASELPAGPSWAGTSLRVALLLGFIPSFSCFTHSLTSFSWEHFLNKSSTNSMGSTLGKNCHQMTTPAWSVSSNLP